jgi:putative holliday junction resolvase
VKTLLALDIGEVRTGVARANSVAQIASPLLVIESQDSLIESVNELIGREDATALVIGLPRSMAGNETSQTTYVRDVAAQIAARVNIPLYFMDEALTSTKAEEELKQRGKPYLKSDIDMLSATYILEDFMRENPEVFDVS